MTGLKLKTYLPGLAFLLALVAAGYVLKGSAPDLLSKTWIDAQIRGQGAFGQLVFVLVAGIATSFAVPRHVASFLGGYAFGVEIGTLLALAATELGCLVDFLCARHFARPLVAARFGERVRRIDAFLAANPFLMTLLIRFLPVGNNFATSLCGGVSSVPAGPFLLGSLAGYLPLTLVFALAGSGVEVGGGARLALAALLFVASGTLGIWLYRHYRRGRTLGEEVEKSL